MVAHDAKVVNCKRMLLFHLFDVGKKERAHGNFVENHLSAVDFSRDMIDGILFQVSFVSHAYYRAQKSILLY
jgi:hypothetical protein